jgi:hypothetical protein
MTEQVISPLQCMIEDLMIRKFGTKTQHDYVQRVKDFEVFLGRSPDTARAEDVRRFQPHLTSDRRWQAEDRRSRRACKALAARRRRRARRARTTRGRSDRESAPRIGAGSRASGRLAGRVEHCFPPLNKAAC